jgi:glutamate synthase (NADPH/NADH) small chain
MNNVPRPGSQAKYAWSELERVDPPRRSASNRVSDFHQTASPYDEATASEQASRCIQCPNPNCTTVCPVETPIAELLALTADRQFKEASELLFQRNPLPEIASHVCLGGRLCETACLLGSKSDPVPIRSITKFLLDYGWKHGLANPPDASASGYKIAVIGSGICGLVAADALSRLGHAVTVIDSRSKPGGRMMNGLPGFRVDKEMVERRLELLVRRGIQFRMNAVCGKDVQLAQLQRDFDAVLLGFNRSEAVPLDIPGAELKGVWQAHPFVAHNSSGLEGGSICSPDVQGKSVVVLGGGDTAMDALRTAIRCGARDALCIYHRDAGSMPADREEYSYAVEEGARFHFRTQPVAVLGNASGAVSGVRCVKAYLGEPDESGRPSVNALAGSDFEVEADIVMVAYGFAPATLPQAGGFADLALNAHGWIVVDANQKTNLPGVFAAGSIVRGPAPLALVVQDSRKAAAAIHQYLSAGAKGA